MSGPLTLFFDEYEEAHEPIVGGKCASLGSMTRAGLPVPPGFAVTTHAFVESMAGVRGVVGELVDGLDVADLAQLASVAERCRQTVGDAGPSARAEDAVRAGYRQLGARTGDPEPRVAVRSSETAEDQPDASFAGQQDTWLWISGEDEVVDHVVRLLGEHVHRPRHRLPHGQRLSARRRGDERGCAADGAAESSRRSRSIPSTAIVPASASSRPSGSASRWCPAWSRRTTTPSTR